MGVRSLWIAAVAMLVVGGCVTNDGGGLPRAVDLPPGTTFTDRIRVGQHVVPLPPGEWILAGVEDAKSNMIDGSMRTPIARVVLIRPGDRPDDKSVNEMMLIVANGDSQLVEWVADQQCQSDAGKLYMQNGFRSERDQLCITVVAATASWGVILGQSPLSQNVVGWLRAGGYSSGPESMLVTRFRVVSGNNLLATFHFSTARELGVRSARDADWQPSARTRNAEIDKIFNERVAWAREWAPVLRSAVDGRLPPPKSTASK